MKDKLNAIKRCIFYIEILRSTLSKIAADSFIRKFLPFSEVNLRQFNKTKIIDPKLFNIFQWGLS